MKPDSTAFIECNSGCWHVPSHSVFFQKVASWPVSSFLFLFNLSRS